MATVLYIEDDKEIGGWVKDHLERAGYRVDWLPSGERAAERVKDSDIVVLDVMLPGLDGFTVGRRLKAEAPSVPILMLSARTDVEDKLTGLQFADDYVTKPFHPDELTARIEVLLRRSDSPSRSELRVGHLRIRPQDNAVTDTRTGEDIVLTGKQYHIFMYLLKHANRILTKEQIYEAVWGEPYLEGDKTVHVHIRYLREKIELDPSAPTIVETIRGIGYRVKL
ncbi:response regulator transcription factor [Paenibacillus sp.]|uniref:response regulator transcription factor n=1 Tax=Paenibacillus sp. TaxID=58172 RepID=UPI002D412880|nr:response regulator transcription factor [Paenibacillus sp.]HZG84755.1 response regulator transcription factor [Paenibacillus sp.]